MKYSRLGRSDLQVSRVCLGTMTWGVQNTQADANQQLAYALDQGVNFVDTAEMYPIPPKPENHGVTEKIIGKWLAEDKRRRDQIILASKIVGNGVTWIRNGDDIYGKDIASSIEASLKRLQTDYLDLYQLHWPNYPTSHFAKHWPNRIRFSDYDVEKAREDMLGIIEALDACVKAGKIRHWGVSNDSPWGISEYLRLANEMDLAPPVSVQNEFSLVHTKDWPHMLEQCVRSDVAYLPWSPLGGGLLSGKYLDGARPAGSRWTMVQRKGLLRAGGRVDNAVKVFQAIAEKYGMTSSQLALRWCDEVDGVTSTIIGATSMAQLQENISAFELPYPEELAEEVTAALREHPLPF